MLSFSIVIPTRNRAHLLQYALQSALDQKYDDLEIIVSDNYSTDNTAEVVRQHKDSRLKYVRTNEALSMPDSWEFALSHANGDYVTFLCDDDAINPRLIETIAKIIKEQQSDVVCWGYQGYIHPTWYQPEFRNILYIKKFSKRVIKMDSRLSLISLCSALSQKQCDMGPRMLNSACSRSVIELVKEKIGRFFLPPNPDCSTYVAVLAVTEQYTFIDDSLLLGGTGRESIGSSSSRSGTGAASNYVKEFKDQKIINHAPLKSLTVANSIAETILNVKHAMPNDLNDIDINWQNYFVICHEQLLMWRRNGTDISSNLREFWDVLSKMPLSFQTVVRLRILKSILSPGRIAINVLPMVPTPIRTQIKFFCLRSMSINVIKGKDYGFSNILECVRKLDDIQKHYS